MEKFCGAVYSATQKREVILVWLVTKAHVIQGVPRSERVHSIDPDPWRKASFTSRCAVVNYRFCDWALILE